MALEAVGNVALGVHQKIAWQTDNPFIRATTGRWRQFGDSSIRYINADDGEIAIVELPNIRATLATDAFSSIGVRIGTDAFDEIHASLLTIVRCLVKPI